MSDKKMSDDELLAIINQAEDSAIKYNGEFMAINDKLMDYYNGEPFGDEVDERSQVISTDVLDLVESDMPSLARIFLGATDPVKFTPLSDKPEDIEEAENKTTYIKSIVDNQEDGFKIMHDWLKGGELQQVSVLEYGVEDVKKTKTKRYDGLSEIEIDSLLSEMKQSGDKVEVIGHDINEDGSYYLEVRTTGDRQEFFYRNVTPEDFIISKGAIYKNKAEIIGTRSKRTRSDLIASGFDKATVRTLASDDKEEYSTKWERHKDQGGAKETNDVKHWTNEEVTVSNLYVLVDFDNDGIAERRHIIKAGNKILENEPFDHVPFALFSTILMPHKLIGRARGELAMETQRTKSVVNRQMLDNLYAVNTPRNVVNDDNVELDDFLTHRVDGIIRTDGIPSQDVMPLTTPFVGDKALLVLQYLDAGRAQSTGQDLVNQGLNADAVAQETATRYEGVKEKGAEKIELVARVIAETGIKQLYEGLAWFVSHYQDDEAEIRVLGKQVTINPKDWQYDHKIKAQVGLGAGTKGDTPENLSVLLQLQKDMILNGSTLADEEKIYNTVSRIIKSMGFHQISEFINNPDIPAELHAAENAMLKAEIKNMQQPNQLAEAEQVKAQAAIQIANAKHQMDMIKLQADITSKHDIEMKKIMAKFAELELKFGTDIPGQGIGL